MNEDVVSADGRWKVVITPMHDAFSLTLWKWLDEEAAWAMTKVTSISSPLEHARKLAREIVEEHSRRS